MNERMKAGLHLPCPLFQVALETLLLRGPQKPRTHPLASYRYTGEWSVTAGMVWAWLRPLRASQFPRQSGVVSGSHLPSREGLYSPGDPMGAVL